MTLLFPRAAAARWLPAALLLLLPAGCRQTYDRTEVESGNQGSWTFKTVHVDPPPAQPTRPVAEAPAPPPGPTAHEVEMQKRIEDLESQSKSLNAEIERLKREQSKP